MKIVQDEDGKTIWECPQSGCGHGDITGNEGTDQDLLHPIRRTCGYIGSNKYNTGRTREIADRVLHLQFQLYIAAEFIMNSAAFFHKKEEIDELREYKVA